MKKQKSMKKKQQLSNNLGHLFLSVLSVIWVIPIAWLIMASFREEPGAFTNYVIPKSFTLNNYKNLFIDTSLFNFPRWFMNTLFVAVISATISTILVLATSYAFSRLRFILRKPMMDIILVLGMFSGFMALIAIYHILKAMGLDQSLWALILVYSGGAWDITYRKVSLIPYPK